MICLIAGAVAVSLGADHLTLQWTHSVEKTLWEEDWREVDGRLTVLRERVRGSGAGMEPAPEARLVNGAWTWKPNVPPLPEITLRRSGATADWRLCLEGACRPMGDYVGAEADPVVMKACTGPSSTPTLGSASAPGPSGDPAPLNGPERFPQRRPGAIAEP